MHTPGPVFTRPRTPAAQCLHLVRLNPIVTRNELVEATGLSQPTITRATAALLRSGLIHERRDLTRSQGRGRPTVPLEASENDWILVGIAVGTAFTHIGFYDVLGRTLKRENIATPVGSDHVEHIIAGVNRLATGLPGRLASIGVTTSGTVDANNLVTAPNLGWEAMDIASELRYHFAVPVVVSSVIPAILGSETQAALHNEHTALLYADDSVGAALSRGDEVHPYPLDDAHSLTTHAILSASGCDSLASASRPLLDERARRLGRIAAQLIEEFSPSTLVVAGGAFLDDASAPKLFAATVRAAVGPEVQLRLIPSYSEIVRAVTRAIALDPLMREPLELA
ncbi:ROK family transcriptional regulator [Corynebacterium sp.]|uniref:ROK family transcriptional regulator n=1 Tax=Corynebacterium sp. TaxID=1720 RepID=UPI0026DB4AFD|nr:ROK family protein [Corynebacterium sp.]MDO5032599.1 ROK family protein [Corynebacterium sp.]